MKQQIIIAICVLAIAGYLGYQNFMKGDENIDDKNLRSSFQALGVAISSKNTTVIKNLLSPGFTDRQVSNEEFIEVLTLPRKSYVTKIDKITFQGDLGSISYTRSETRGDGEPIDNFKVKGETWMKDKKNPRLWRLYRLAANDKWFRTVAIPQKRTPEKMIAKAEEPVLGTLEKEEGKVLSMRKSERYSSIRRRDPFMPLIAMAGEETAGVENCDPDRPREPLESFDLLSLKLTGVIITDQEPVALIRAPDGKGHTVRVDMYLGKMCGKVVEINSDRMIIREKKRAPGSLPGEFKPAETELKLRHEEG